jgi:hypothetical protein
MKFWNRVQHRLEQHPIAHLAVLYGICVALFLVTIPIPRVDGQLIGSDGIYYYAYLPTLLLDHDLDFSNQYARLVPENAKERIQLSATGRLGNKWAIGSAILWMPFFLIGHLLAIILQASGYSISLDGTGYIYQAPTLLGSLTYGFVGLLLLYRSCCRFFNRSSSAAAVILIWLATNIIYYMIAEPSMSHSCSFFSVSLFIYLWLRFRPLPRFHQWIFLGLAGGLVALVRLPDTTWLMLPVLDSLPALLSERKSLGRRLAGLLAFGVTAALVFLPQIAVWQTLYGAPTQTGYIHGGARFYWFAPKILRLLFSMHHGLYLWHPVLLFGTAGLALLFRKDRIFSFALTMLFASQLYIIGAWYGWSGGDSFGNRMMISSLPALAIGLAAWMEWASTRKILAGVGILSCSLIIWNALFFAQYRLGYISMMKPITFYELTLGKFSMLKDIGNHLRTIFH